MLSGDAHNYLGGCGVPQLGKEAPTKKLLDNDRVHLAPYVVSLMLTLFGTRWGYPSGKPASQGKQ